MDDKINLNCEVCGNPDANILRCSIATASFAYCSSCIREGLEPYDMIVSVMAVDKAKTVDHYRDDYFASIIKDSIEKVGKTLEELYADVQEEINSDEEEEMMFEEAEKMGLFDDSDDDPYFK